jgi:hypothetical protein
MNTSDSSQIASDPKGAISIAHVEQLTSNNEQLPAEHREYLLARHGTLDLTPLPSIHPQDPFNWPTWKKDIFLGLITFHAMMSTFGAAAVVPAFEDLSKRYQRSIPTISYLVSIQVCRSIKHLAKCKQKWRTNDRPDRFSSTGLRRSFGDPSRSVMVVALLSWFHIRIRGSQHRRRLL